MVRRHELTDAEWARLVPLLPPCQGNGHPYRAHRRVLNGMLFRLHTRVPWRDLPTGYGKWQTVYSRWRRWTRAGLWERLLATLQRELDATGGIEWELWCIDGSSIRAQKAAAGRGNNEHRPAGTRRAE